MTSTLLHAENISVRRGDRIVLASCNLSVGPGDRIAIYGPNGAGKSTMLQALSALLPIASGAISFRGKGECLALGINVPEPGLFPVRCQLVLSDLPPPFIGGLLTTNTIASKASFGGDTDPSGYTQASIATIRLWKAR